MIKMEIRSLTIPYAKNKAKNVSRTLEKQLESPLESLEDKINGNPDDGTDAEQQENTSVSKLNYVVSTWRGQRVLSLVKK